MQNFFIDTLDTNLQIHSNTGSVQFFLQTPIEGLDFADVRFVSYDKPGEDGGEASSLYYGGRTVTLNGIFQGTTIGQYEANRQLLARSVSIRRSSTGRPQPLRCTFTTVGGNSFFFDGYISKKPVFDWDELKWGKFLIQLYIPDAALLAGVRKTSDRLYIATTGGTTLPWTLPVTLAASSGGIIYVTNNGNSVALPVLRYTGPLTSPQVVNADSGLYMELDYTISNGDYVDVDMNKKIIMLNGNSPILSVKSDGSDWWGLDSGTTLLRLFTDSGSNAGYVEALYYDSYVGV